MQHSLRTFPFSSPRTGLKCFCKTDPSLSNCLSNLFLFVTFSVRTWTACGSSVRPVIACLCQSQTSTLLKSSSLMSERLEQLKVLCLIFLYLLCRRISVPCDDERGFVFGTTDFKGKCDICSVQFVRHGLLGCSSDDSVVPFKDSGFEDLSRGFECTRLSSVV